MMFLFFYSVQAITKNLQFKLLFKILAFVIFQSANSLFLLCDSSVDLPKLSLFWFKQKLFKVFFLENIWLAKTKSSEIPTALNNTLQQNNHLLPKFIFTALPRRIRQSSLRCTELLDSLTCSAVKRLDCKWKRDLPLEYLKENLKQARLNPCLKYFQKLLTTRRYLSMAASNKHVLN